MKRVSTLIAAALLLPAPHAAAGSEESGIISLFEAICLNNLSDFSGALTLAERSGLTEIQDPDREVLLNGSSGRAWISRAGTQPRFFLKLLDSGVCTVAAPYADKHQIEALFQKYIRHKLVNEEPSGTEMHEIFAVTHPDGRNGSDVHGMVILQISQMDSEPGISLLAVTEKAAIAAGISPQDYP